MAKDLNQLVLEEKNRFLKRGQDDRSSEALAFLSTFEKSDKDEQVILAPLFNDLSEKLQITTDEWKSYENLLRSGGRGSLDPFGFGIDMTSPLGKMIS